MDEDFSPQDLKKADKSSKEPLLDTSGSLDDSFASIIKSAPVRNRGRLNSAVIESIAENISHGISLSTASMYVGVSPSTLATWLKTGQEQVDALSDSEIELADGELESLVGIEGRLFLKLCRAKANAIVELHNMLYERAFESGKEWLATYILERAEPEKYNLKYKVQQDVSSNVSANVVEFKFINGPEVRPPEDKEFIDAKMDELKEQYKDHDVKLAKDE